MAWPVRYKMIVLLFCGSVINYVDRVNISVAAAVGVVCAAILLVVPVRPIHIETFAPAPVAVREAVQ